MHPFTARKVREAKAQYEAMCKPKGVKGAIPNRSIHRKFVWGQGYAYHGHVNA
jgi:hypothetical protein